MSFWRSKVSFERHPFFTPATGYQLRSVHFSWNLVEIKSYATSMPLTSNGLWLPISVRFWTFVSFAHPSIQLE